MVLAYSDELDESSVYPSRRQRKAGKKKIQQTTRQPRQTKTQQPTTEFKGLDLKDIRPMTENQADVFHQSCSGQHLLLIGSAGTGKTFLSFYLGLSEVLYSDEDYKKIVVVRSAVQSRDQGFLPGSVAEKQKVYELPYHSICGELFNRGDAYGLLKAKGQVEFITTSFVRGITLKDCIVVVDEIQNMNWAELSAIMTRVGDNCRIIFSGDFRQSDLTKEQERVGLKDFVKVIDRLDQFSTIIFTQKDIVRSKLVKDFIVACEELKLY